MTTNICNRCFASVVLTEHGGLDFRDEESEERYKETLLCQACQDHDDNRASSSIGQSICLLSRGFWVRVPACLPRARSSIGQSSELIIHWLSVRVRPGPPLLKPIYTILLSMRAYQITAVSICMLETLAVLLYILFLAIIHFACWLTGTPPPNLPW